jgi:THUMP domain-like/RNA cap guanine-N2 methyltransferase
MIQPPPPGTSERDEWDILHELRATPQILERIAQVSGSELHLQKLLRREYSDKLVRAALSLHELRIKARDKFSRADEMWFDRRGLEQATSEPVARHKAQRFEGAAVDLCCGIGGDALALAQRCEVAAVDLSPIACLRTYWNACAYGVESRVSTLCQSAESVALDGRLVYIDPDRRAGGAGRAVRVEDYVPALEFLTRLTHTARGGAIKLSPAANFGGKFPAAEVELVSLNGECKEATIWFGELATAAPWRATLLPSGLTIAGDPMQFAAPIALPEGYIYDPDPAVVRAGMVDAVATELGLMRLDDREEYLTGSQPVDSPFVQRFELIVELCNRPTDIRAYFRESPFGQLEIKARHIPIDVPAIRAKLTLPGDLPGVLIFARIAGRAKALVCRRDR